jgi:hypothetical protein
MCEVCGHAPCSVPIWIPIFFALLWLIPSMDVPGHKKTGKTAVWVGGGTMTGSSGTESVGSVGCARGASREFVDGMDRQNKVQVIIRNSYQGGGLVIMRSHPMWKLAFPGRSNLRLYFISVYPCPSVVNGRCFASKTLAKKIFGCGYAALCPSVSLCG